MLVCKASLTPPFLFIKVHVFSMESDRSCIQCMCDSGIDFASDSTIFRLDLGIVYGIFFLYFSSL